MLELVQIVLLRAMAGDRLSDFIGGCGVKHHLIMRLLIQLRQFI